jgi:hypothetical protein
MGEIEKVKKAPPKPRSWAGYGALIVAVGLCLFLMWCDWQSYDLIDRGQTLTFFPMVMIAQGLARWPIEFMIVLFVPLFVFAAWRLARPLPIVAAGIITLGLFGVAWLGAIIDSDITPVQMLQRGHAQYRLIAIYGGGLEWGYSSPVKAYSTLKCDSTGLLCQYHATLYLVEEYLSEEWLSFDEGAELFSSGSGSELMLRVGDKVCSGQDRRSKTWEPIRIC